MKNRAETRKKIFLWLVGMAAMGAFYYEAGEKDGWGQRGIAIFFILVMLFYGVRGVIRSFTNSPYNIKNLLKNGIKTEGKIVRPYHLYPSNQVCAYEYEYFDKDNNRYTSLADRKNMDEHSFGIGTNIEVYYNEGTPKINVILIS